MNFNNPIVTNENVMAIILNKKRKSTITRRRNNNNERLLLLDNNHHPPTVELGTLIIPFLRYNKTKRLVIKRPSKDDITHLPLVKEGGSDENICLYYTINRN